jgi:hypothetical protein
MLGTAGRDVWFWHWKAEPTVVDFLKWNLGEQRDHIKTDQSIRVP